jgi:NAD/NADP transhydrogenase beta subunit
MSLPFYHYLHLIGLILVFIGFGGLFSSEGAKKAMMWHGIGLVISFVSAFGMLAKMSKGLPEGSPSLYTQPWVIAKMVLWLVLGFLPVLAKRRVIAAPLVVLIAAIVGAALAYLGYFKPAF